MKLNELSPHLLYQFSSESELHKEVQRLKLIFNDSRDVGSYVLDEKLVAAYTSFYFLTYLNKFNELSSYLPNEVRTFLTGLSFIDMGAGPGTFGFAWAKAVHSDQIYQVEKSSLMREQSKRIFRHFLPQCELVQNLSPPKKGLMFFGNSLNEMGSILAEKEIKKYEPQAVVLLEPGTKQSFKEVLLLRDKLISMGYHCAYPCPCDEKCPMEGSLKEWCHQYISFRFDDELEALCQQLKMDRKLQSAIFHVYLRSELARVPVITRVKKETKFSYEWEVCDGKKICSWQIPKKDLKSKKALKDILAGQRVELKLEKDFGNFKRGTPNLDID